MAGGQRRREKGGVHETNAVTRARPSQDLVGQGEGGDFDLR